MIRVECHEQLQLWMDKAKWFVCSLEAEDFQKLLVFNGGWPLSGWQMYSNGSYEIADVALGVREYSGDKDFLIKSQSKILTYKKRMEEGELPRFLCLVKSKGKSRVTLFETNHRAIAMYLYYFVDSVAAYKPVNGVLAEVHGRLPIQSQ